MKRRFVVTILALWLLLVAVPVMAAPVTLPVTPGWDAYPSLVSGEVVRDFNPATGELDLTYSLTGSVVTSSIGVYFDIFNPSPDVPWFGLSQLGESGVYTREGNTAYVDIFEVGQLSVNSQGTGTATFVLNLYNAPGVAAGTYNIQYVFVTAPSGGLALYRTGSQFDVGFDTIVVPTHAPVPVPATLLLLGPGLLGLASIRRRLKK